MKHKSLTRDETVSLEITRDTNFKVYIGFID